VIRDRVRDEAIAIAKASHPEVQLRHVLWGLLRALDDDAPTEVTPAWSSSSPWDLHETPTVSTEAEAPDIDHLARVGRRGLPGPGRKLGLIEPAAIGAVAVRSRPARAAEARGRR
jgi:hypothetical protein